MINKLVMATNNASKLREAREILAPLGIEVIGQREAGVSVQPEENGATFEENSKIKAEAIFGAIESSVGECLPVIADDSGLCVDALDGRPGVMSARYAPDGQECDKLLSELEGTAAENRTARFVCGITFLDKNGKIFFVDGVCEGRIGFEKRGENGFGYDPVFTVGDRTLAEMTADEKNKISHRGKAMRALFDLLKERYGD